MGSVVNPDQMDTATVLLKTVAEHRALSQRVGALLSMQSLGIVLKEFKGFITKTGLRTCDEVLSFYWLSLHHSQKARKEE